VIKIPLSKIFGSPPPALLPGRSCQAAYGCSLLYALLKVILSAVFIYAGLVKLLDPRTFAHSIDQYGLLPEALLPAAALGLPALELLTGAGLLLEIRGSLTTIVILLLMFLAVLGYALWLELDIDCGCFTGEELSARDGVKTAFWRDLALLAAAAFLFWRRRVRRRGNRLGNSLFIHKTKGES
jgi:uncharacterized membrane protein YphA (DoxX/SURF4 family)